MLFYTKIACHPKEIFVICSKWISAFRKYNNFEKCTSIFLTYFDCVLCITSHILRIEAEQIQILQYRIRIVFYPKYVNLSSTLSLASCCVFSFGSINRLIQVSLFGSVSLSGLSFLRIFCQLLSLQATIASIQFPR